MAVSLSRALTFFGYSTLATTLRDPEPHPPQRFVGNPLTSCDPLQWFFPEFGGHSLEQSFFRFIGPVVGVSWFLLIFLYGHRVFFHVPEPIPP